MVTTRRQAADNAKESAATPADNVRKIAPPPSSLEVFVRVVAAVATGSLRSALDFAEPRKNINRTAAFMLVFLVVHMLGNLTLFISPEAFNTYGDLLNKNPALKFIEYYLLAMAVMHAAVGLYLTWLGKKMTASKGFFLFTGLVVLAFIVLHLFTFKFGPNYRISASDGSDMRDLYKLESEVFADPKLVAWYVFAVTILSWHLWRGWSKAVFKMDFIADKAYRLAAEKVGHVLVLLLGLGFVSTPIYLLIQSHQ